MTERERAVHAIANAVGCSGYKDGVYIGCLSREHCGKCDCTLSADAAIAAMSPAWRPIPDPIPEGDSGLLHEAPWDGRTVLLGAKPAGHLVWKYDVGTLAAFGVVGDWRWSFPPTHYREIEEPIAPLSAMSPAWRPIPAEVREMEAPWRRILDTSLRMYPRRGFRVGMRSGMMDAATVCDCLAKRILATKRPTKFQREAAALLTGCGDEIMRMRDEVTVPLDDAPIPPLPAPPSAEER